MALFTKRLDSIKSAANLAGLAHLTRGIEKESLRVDTNGTLAQTSHPKALGSALTHPSVTTDYSEALLEFITPPSQNITAPIETLTDLHRMTYQVIGNELLWVNSMPCMLGNEKNIPIAQYGTSNSGKMKSVYRLGLGHRYGRPMQTIAGTHFNFSVDDELWQFLQQEEKSELSLDDFKTEGYFKLIRNFRRYFWLLLYLFGASPAICRSFVKGREHHLVQVGNDSHSLHSPYATSLRMGNLGYQSNAQDSLVITYNCLESYIDTLCKAITQPNPDYQAKGVFDKNGQHQQLNDSLLQIENEFYSVIRPKRTTKPGQTALNALENGGVEYIEVRCLDLNPFEHVGISEEQIRFLDLFLLFCLLEDSPPSDETEYAQQQSNQHNMVYNGRDPELKLFHFGEEKPFTLLATNILSKLDVIAKLLDSNESGTKASSAYSNSVAREKAKIDNSSLTPSAKIIAEMQSKEITFFRWAMNTAQKNKLFFQSQAFDKDKASYFENLAKESLLKQEALESASSMTFDEYLKSFYAQYRCSPAVFQPKPVSV